MINTLKIFNDLKQTMDPMAAEKIVDVIGAVYEELKNSVTKTEFNELKEVVRDLAEAQKRTETRLDDLAEAQKRTEIRLEKLTERVDELAEAQKRTEIRLEKLTERVDDLTQRMVELTSNVSRLERKVEDLVGEMKRMKVSMQDMRQEIGGLSHAIGYGLEDQSYLTLPSILNRDQSITLKGRLKRGFLETGPNKYIEINIWGQGERDGKSIEIIGEAKTQLKKKDVDKFLQTIQALQPHIGHSIHPLFVTYQTSPAVTQYTKDKGISLYFTYDLQAG
jgi:DNA repair exonuclease SbcCD ATPase subunit